jgi:hypothetical protein
MVSFVVGVLYWTLNEYVIHRFVGHGRRRERPATLRQWLAPGAGAALFNAEHVAHHRQPDHFGPAWAKVAASIPLLALLFFLSRWLVGFERALLFTLGYGLSYAGYEVMHFRIHLDAPAGPYGRWIRRNHLAHHYLTTRANHGVTCALWDYVFRTHAPLPAVIRVPRQVAPSWLLAAPERYARDYTVV